MRVPGYPQAGQAVYYYQRPMANQQQPIMMMPVSNKGVNPVSGFNAPGGESGFGSQMMLLMQTMMLMLVSLLTKLLPAKPQAPETPDTEALSPPPAEQKPETADKKPPVETPTDPVPGGSSRNVQIEGGGTNRAILVNHGKKPIEVEIMTNPTPEKPNSVPTKVTIQPGETVCVEIPKSWAGRIYKRTGDGSKVTLNEVTYDGHGGQMFYDQSVIDGYNGPVTMTPTNAKTSGNGRPVTVGSKKDITEGAPESMRIKNPDGTYCLDGVAPVGDNASKPDHQKYYLNALGEGTAYTYPKDDVASTRIVVDNSINIDFY